VDDLLITILSFWSASGVLVAVTSSATWVARRLGHSRLRFAIGRPATVGGGWPGQDRVRIRDLRIPLGGYVKLLDERRGPVPVEERRGHFTSQPHWKRIALRGGARVSTSFCHRRRNWILLLAGILLKAVIG